VGSFIVEGLVRGGIGKFVLIDHDNICHSNLNRQLHATTKTIGRAKVEVMKERILDINPKAEVITHQSFYLPEKADEIIGDDWDYIIDAIDTITAKIDLVVQAKKRNIPIIIAIIFALEYVIATRYIDKVIDSIEIIFIKYLLLSKNIIINIGRLMAIKVA